MAIYMGRWVAGVVAALAVAALTARAIAGEAAARVPGDRPLPDGALMRIGTLRWRHQGMVSAVAFSPDGRLLASGAISGGLRIWDAPTGQEIRCLGSAFAWVRSVAFSRDGRRLASGTQERGDKVQVWDVVTGAAVASFEANREMVRCVAFSPDGQMVASGDSGGAVLLWNMQTGMEFVDTPWHGRGVSGIEFSPDGRFLASCGGDGMLQVWQLDTAKTSVFTKVHGHSAECIAFSPDGKAIASGGERLVQVDEHAVSDVGELRLWDAATGVMLREFQPDAEDVGVVAVAFSPDGQVLAAKCWDETLRLWDPTTGRHLSKLQGREDYWHGGSGGLAFSPDGKRLASGGPGHIIRLWDVASGQQLLPDPEGHLGHIWCVTVSPDGATIASSSSDGTIRFCEAATGRPVRSIRVEAYDVAYSPDGTSLASASYDTTVRLWDATSGEQIWVAQGEPYVQARRVAFSPDGRLLASVHTAEGPIPGAQSSSVRIWEGATGRQLMHEELPEQWGPEAIGFSADGGQLIAAGSDAVVRFWDVSSGAQRDSLRIGPEAWMGGAALSRGADLLAVSFDEEEAVQLWNLARRERLRDLPHAGRALALAFSADGILLALASYAAVEPAGAEKQPTEFRCRLQVFEVATGRRELECDLADEGQVSSLAFYPDGRKLVAAVAGGTLLIWELGAAR